MWLDAKAIDVDDSSVDGKRVFAAPRFTLTGRVEYNPSYLRALTVATSPPKILNVTGPEVIAVRWIAGEFARRFGVEPAFVGEEAPTALLNNAAEAFRLFGYPRVTLGQMIDWTADWIQRGGPVHDKPTHFQEREGNF